MTEEVRQQLKVLINTLTEQKIDLEVCVDKILELFQENGQVYSTTNQQHRRRSSSIFEDGLICPPANTSQRRRSSTYNEKGFVNNTNTILYANHDID